MPIALNRLRNDLRRLEASTMASFPPIKAHENHFKDYLNVFSDTQNILETFVCSSEDLILSFRIRSGSGLGFMLRCRRCEDELVCMLLVEGLEL
jgi:hypothetical protein